ncbi:hypothetical protein BASA83_005344 [Batrachochytrium salamandrivorans]|nr:hypothetical protein BASA83_005344 [Batrachochytrium salamandrivorans]
MSFEYYRTTDLYCKAEKCHFYKSETKYLGYIISADGLRMDPSKISAVQSWPTPKETWTANLTKLFKKNAPFVWGPEQEKSLQDLKTAFAKSDFLTHPDDSRPFILETDASDYAISAQNKITNLRQRATGRRRVIQTLAAFPSRRSPSSHRLVRSQELGVLHDDQEINSSSGSLVSGIIRVRLLAYSSTRQVLEKVFVLESDWPLIIADFLAGEDNVWMDDVRKSSGEMQTELKHFRFRDNSFLRILEDGKSTAAYVTTDKRVDVMKQLSHLVGALEVWIDH